MPKAPEPRVSFTATGWEDYQYWAESDRAVLRRINRLIQQSLRDPFDGIGKPEPLKHAFGGCWSRRIDEEHRLVYIFERGQLTILQCRYHY